ncbi:hypothetical protein KY327_00460 [Candidatus Woesearchaeota archaeon]|nr:hypothetical protein [Candidatus Woesearchaeota archaeon]
MMQSLEDAQEELKRVDHQIYVSLKYTRTVDVLLNILNRMIDGYEYLIEALLKIRIEEGQAERIPASPIERGNLVKELYPDDEVIVDNMGLFFLLRKLFRSNPQREQEYRRNVTLRTVVEGREEIVNIDIITNYYQYMLQFYRRVDDLVKNYQAGKEGEKESDGTSES